MLDSDATDIVARLAATLVAARETRSRLEKRRLLVDFLRPLDDANLRLAATYLCGRPFARADSRTTSAGGAVLSAALLTARPERTEADLRAAWNRHADAGDMAAELWDGFSGSDPPVRLGELAALFDHIAGTRAPAEKASLLASAFRRMHANEIRAAVKILLGETRMGIREGTVEDAIAHLTGQDLELVRRTNRHLADIGEVAVRARSGSDLQTGFVYFRPVDPMLAQPASGTEEVLRRMRAPVWVEDKYDGVRCQLHKSGGDVRLYSRDRKEITRQFPEVAAAFRAVGGDFALDCELMALENGRSLPFSRLQQRLNRLAPSADIVAAHPAALVAFDLLAFGDEALLDAPLSRRRERLEAIALPGGHLLATRRQAQDESDLDRLFTEAQSRGNEGLMCKDADSCYASGRRGYQWLKLKRPMETLDVVIVGAEWGHGKRRALLSDYTFAIRNEETGALLTIGKAYGGLTDADIGRMTVSLQAITQEEHGRYRTVRPEIVLEVEFNGIQKSARHRSGYALRFPRIVRIRDDKSPADISTLADVVRLWEAAEQRAG